MPGSTKPHADAELTGVNLRRFAWYLMKSWNEVYPPQKRAHQSLEGSQVTDSGAAHRHGYFSGADSELQGVIAHLEEAGIDVRALADEYAESCETRQ